MICTLMCTALLISYSTHALGKTFQKQGGQGDSDAANFIKEHGDDVVFGVTKGRWKNGDVGYDVTRTKEVADLEFDVTRVKRSGTFDVSTLGMIVQQQAAMIQLIQSDLAAAQNKIAALEKSHNRTLPPVGFHARFTHDSTKRGLPVTPNSVLKFDKDLANVGKAFSPLTGVFTAPRSGLYVFFLHISSPSRTEHVSVSLLKNDVPIVHATTNGVFEDDQSSAEMVVHLDAGGRVYPRQDSGPSVEGMQTCTFAGFLVQAN